MSIVWVSESETELEHRIYPQDKLFLWINCIDLDKNTFTVQSQSACLLMKILLLYHMYKCTNGMIKPHNTPVHTAVCLSPWPRSLLISLAFTWFYNLLFTHAMFCMMFLHRNPTKSQRREKTLTSICCISQPSASFLLSCLPLLRSVWTLIAGFLNKYSISWDFYLQDVLYIYIICIVNIYILTSFHCYLGIVFKLSS